MCHILLLAKDRSMICVRFWYVEMSNPLLFEIFCFQMYLAQEIWGAPQKVQNIRCTTKSNSEEGTIYRYKYN